MSIGAVICSIAETCNKEQRTSSQPTIKIHSKAILMNNQRVFLFQYIYLSITDKIVLSCDKRNS